MEGLTVTATRELSEVIEMVCVLIGMMVTFTKSHQIVHLKPLQFTVGRFYLNFLQKCFEAAVPSEGVEGTGLWPSGDV